MRLSTLSLSAILFFGCTPGSTVTPKTVITDILTADQIACIVEQAAAAAGVATLPANVVALQCNVAPGLLTDVEQLLGASSRGIAAAKAPAKK